MLRAIIPHFIPALIARVKIWLGHVFVALICAITPRCREMTRLISVEREQPLSKVTQLRMRWHYGICVWCLRYRDQLGLLGGLSRRLAEETSSPCDPRLSEESKSRLKETLSRHHHD